MVGKSSSCKSLWKFPQTFILELLRAGVEPARVLPHYDLNVACLPVSPSQRNGNDYHFHVSLVRTYQVLMFSKRALGEVMVASVTPATLSEII